MKKALAILCAVVASGCFALTPPRSTSELAGYARSFYRLEPGILELAGYADPRIAARAGTRRSWNGYVDPFLFDVRQQQVDALESVLRRTCLAQPKPTDPPRRGLLAALTLEQELLYRLVDEERHRILRERDLPGSAAGLLRAIATGLGAWSSAKARHESDAVFAWRMRQIAEALGPYAVSRAQRDDLTEALEVVDRRAVALPSTRVEIARLRGRLSVTWAASFDLREWEDVATDVKAWLGVWPDEEATAAVLARVGAALRAQAETGLSVLNESDARSVRDRAAALLSNPPPCAWRVSDSVARALFAPPERDAVCAMLRGMHDGAVPHDLDDLVALLAVHDGAAIAARAVDMLGKIRDPAYATSRHPLLSSLSGEAEARWMRRASAHPVDALALGFMAEILVHDGVHEVTRVAGRWLAFGNAPLDIVRREMFAASERAAFPVNSPSGLEDRIDRPRR